MKISNDLIKRIEEITMTDYGWRDGETENMDVLIEDLVAEYEDLLEEYKDYKNKYFDLYYNGNNDDSYEDMIR